jgi:hypothetical protein
MAAPVSLQLGFGGARVDARGPKAPRPAAHRLFVPAGEADDLRQQYLQAALLHGVDLVVRYGRSLDWRWWFCELAEGALKRSLKRAAFAACHGYLVENACGLAARVNGETVYLTRAEILELIPEPVSVASSRDTSSHGLLLDDSINRLLYDFGKFGSNERFEVDLSSLPIVRAKK